MKITPEAYKNSLYSSKRLGRENPFVTNGLMLNAQTKLIQCVSRHQGTRGSLVP